MDRANSRYTNLLSNDDVEDIYNNHQATSNWDEDEEIELESDENELFLRNEYVKPRKNNVLPYKLSTTSMFQNFNRNGSSKNATIKKEGYINSNAPNLVNQPIKDEVTRIETFQVDDSGHGSSSPSSVAYQLPNYDQFAGNLAPSSIYSVLISFFIIFVILAVTIVPKIVPNSQPIDEDFIEDDMPQSSTGEIAQTSYQSSHSDVRCKCICPPPVNPQSSGNESTVQNSDKRRLYVGNTSPDQCNCNNIVLPHYKLEISGSALKEFCVRCECRYQSRNTTTIKRNIIFFMAVLIGLSLYLLIQYLLKHLKLTRRSLPPNLKWLCHQMNDNN